MPLDKFLNVIYGLVLVVIGKDFSYPLIVFYVLDLRMSVVTEVKQSHVIMAFNSC